MLIKNLGNRNLEQRDAEPEGFSLYYKKLNVSQSTDLFASMLNIQLLRFISYWPDPESKAMNAFTQSRKDLKFYPFLPFTYFPRVIFSINQSFIYSQKKINKK